MTPTVYAVGDIHGYSDQLDRALALIEADGGTDARIVFLGDYTDRGPDSRGVLERLAAGWADRRPWTFLLGNHDRMFRRFLGDGTLTDAAIASGSTWLHPHLGGAETLRSYGVVAPRDGRLDKDGPAMGGLTLQTTRRRLSEAARDAVPKAHQAFLAALPTVHETADQVFVHAGIRPGIPLAQQAEDDLVWIRDGFLDDRTNHGRLVVHGHTAVDRPEHHGNRLNLDTGAGYGRPITAAAIEGRDAWALSEAGRVPICPNR